MENINESLLIPNKTIRLNTDNNFIYVELGTYFYCGNIKMLEVTEIFINSLN